MNKYGLLFIWKSINNLHTSNITDATHLLLAVKQYGVGQYKLNGYGGKLHNNETIQQCIVRECQEECGLIVKPDDIQCNGIIEQTFIPTDDNNIKPHTRHIHIYTTNKYSGTMIDSNEMKQHKWYSVADIPTLYSNMWCSDVLWLPSVLNNKYVTGTLTMRSDQVVEHSVSVQDLGM